MHLVTDACPLWTATDRDLEALSLSAPYWAFAWSGGQALARHVIDHPREVAGRTVLVFGAGGGVEALAAAKAGAGRVIASDIDPFAVEALALNAALNGVAIEATDRDLLGAHSSDWDTILVGDVTYESELAERVLDWLDDLQTAGLEVRLADPERGFLDPARLEVLSTYDTPSDIDVDGTNLQSTPVCRLRGRASA